MIFKFQILSSYFLELLDIFIYFKFYKLSFLFAISPFTLNPAYYMQQIYFCLRTGYYDEARNVALSSRSSHQFAPLVQFFAL